MYKSEHEAFELYDAIKAIWGTSAKQFLLEREEIGRLEEIEKTIPASVPENERKTWALVNRMKQLVCLFTLRRTDKHVECSFVYGGEFYKNVVAYDAESNIEKLKYQIALVAHEQIKEILGWRHKI